MFDRGRKDEDTGTESTPVEAGARSGWGGSAGKAAAGETAVIGRSIQINGDLRGEEDLRIEGDVTGTVELRNNSLTIGKEGRIRANVYAKTVIVDGHVEGDLYGSERVVIHSSARVLGNVTAPRVGIDDGAKFKGSVEMDQEAVDRAFGQTKKQTVSGTVISSKPAETKLSTPVKEASAT